VSVMPAGSSEVVMAWGLLRSGGFVRWERKQVLNKSAKQKY